MAVQGLPGSARKRYDDTLQLGDVTFTGNTVTTDYTEVISYEVPFKQIVYPGNGQITEGGYDNRGTLTVDLNDGSNSLSNSSGKIQLRIEDSNDFGSDFVRTDLASKAESGVRVGLGGETGTRESRIYGASERSDIVFYAKTASGTFSPTSAGSSLDFPITVQGL